MSYKNQNKARELRNNQTKQERIFWNFVRNRKFYGYRFLRQYVIDDYIVDFICREKNIIIEIDGGQHNIADNITYDEKRTKFLFDSGYKVIRFWNNEIEDNPEGVFLKLKKEMGITD